MSRNASLSRNAFLTRSSSFRRFLQSLLRFSKNAAAIWMKVFRESRAEAKRNESAKQTDQVVAPLTRGWSAHANSWLVRETENLLGSVRAPALRERYCKSNRIACWRGSSRFAVKKNARWNEVGALFERGLNLRAHATSPLFVRLRTNTASFSLTLFAIAMVASLAINLRSRDFERSCFTSTINLPLINRLLLFTR